MNTFNITYVFKFAEQPEKTFNLILNSTSLDLIIDHPHDMPTWTALDFHQCPNCPLTVDQTPRCPLAENLAEIISKYSSIISYDQVHVTVITPERTISKNTTAQKGLSSLMGLVMPTSGCPHTSYFKPMARFHLPFASEEETIYRSVSMYLMAQYFEWTTGKQIDLELSKLKKIYKNLHIINIQFAERLRAGSEKDSSINALVILDLFTKTLPYVIEDSMEEIRYLFKPFLECDDF